MMCTPCYLVLYLLFFCAVYSRVSAQYDWIKTTVCDLSADPPTWFNCLGQDTAPSPLNQASMTPQPTKQPTPQPTPPPTVPVTPSPTRSPLPNGKRRLLVIIELDGTPAQTGWKLSTLSDQDEDAEENVIYQMPIDSYDYSDANQRIQYEVIVDDEGFYTMTIFDSAGNGFGGTVEIYEDAVVSDSTLLVKEPGFTQVSGTSVSHGFYVGSSPSQFLTLDLVFDDFPHEVAYEIKNDYDGTIFALAWFLTFDSNAEEATITIPIYGPRRGDQEYTLRLWDKGEDGICCGNWGNGGYKLYLGGINSGALLKTGGNYEDKETFQFTIEGDPPPSLSPTPNPTNYPTPLPITSNPTKDPTTADPTFTPSIIPSRQPTLRPISLELPDESPMIPMLSPSSASSADITTLSPSDEQVYSTSSVNLVRPVQVASDAESNDYEPTAFPSSVAPPPTMNNIRYTHSPSLTGGVETNRAESIVIPSAKTDASSASRSMQKQHGCRSYLWHVCVVVNSLCLAWMAVL